jgi:hypothetical protein
MLSFFWEAGCAKPGFLTQKSVWLEEHAVQCFLSSESDGILRYSGSEEETAKEAQEVHTVTPANDCGRCRIDTPELVGT